LLEGKVVNIQVVDEEELSQAAEWLSIPAFLANMILLCRHLKQAGNFNHRLRGEKA
jgi:hypothetical protein